MTEILKCRAVCAIRIWHGQWAEPEMLFGICYEIDAPSETAAKAEVTRRINRETAIQDIVGLAYTELPDWWTPRPVRWEGWKAVRRETYQNQPTYIYVECSRDSRVEFKQPDDMSQASASIRASIQLAWLEKQDSTK